MEPTMTPRLLPLLSTLALAALLSACGGGGDDDTAAGGGGGGALTLSATTPATQATTIDLSTATTKGNLTRAADAFSSVPYCEVFWENAKGANGETFAVQVYFRQGDAKPMHVSVIANSGWVAFASDRGNAIGGVAVDAATRTLTFTNRALLSDNAAGTLNGTTLFEANGTTPACGR
jgi:hypothetical protein